MSKMGRMMENVFKTMILAAVLLPCALVLYEDSIWVQLMGVAYIWVLVAVQYGLPKRLKRKGNP